MSYFDIIGVMKTLPRKPANILWDAWWDEMRDEWFKVEVLQDYYAEDAGLSLDSWLKGNKQKSIELMADDPSPQFTEKCQQKLKQSAKLVRIHVVEEPHTPYIDWEIEFYKQISIPHRGKKVYLLRRPEVKHLEIPGGGVMVFGKKRVVVNKYNSRGLMTHETFYDKNDDIDRFLLLKKRLWNALSRYKFCLIYSNLSAIS